jgi:hypothetical protein
VLQLQGVIDHDAPRPRVPTPPAPIVPQAGPSRKRKVDVIDIDADEEDSDVKPDNKDRLTTRVGWLEVHTPLLSRHNTADMPATTSKC